MHFEKSGEKLSNNGNGLLVEPTEENVVIKVNERFEYDDPAQRFFRLYPKAN